MARQNGSGAAAQAVISRRDAIIGALAIAAGTLMASKPEAALAAAGDPVLVGRTLGCSGMAWLQRTPSGATGADTYCDALMTSAIGPGYYGFFGQADTLAGPGSGGVFGSAGGAGQFGMWAANNAPGGVGLRASSTDGTALQVQGAASFSRSGRGSIAKGQSSTTVTGLTNLGTNALILVTLQGSAGTGVVLRYAKRLASTKFQVVLNKAATSKVYFAWMVLN